MTVCPPFVTIGLLIELLPNMHEGSIYRFNTNAGGKKRLPPYDLTVGPARMWELDTILDWAESNRIQLDQGVLERIEKEQSA